MGKSIPIALSNGKKWSKKGEADQHFRSILHKYQVGDRVNDLSDHSDLSALLTIYDAEVPAGQPTKIGCGIDYFEKGIDTDHIGNSTCFFVVRKDKTRIDFSIGKALDAASRQSKEIK
jgi:hypothetical protein